MPDTPIEYSESIQKNMMELRGFYFNPKKFKNFDFESFKKNTDGTITYEIDSSKIAASYDGYKKTSGDPAERVAFMAKKLRDADVDIVLSESPTPGGGKVAILKVVLPNTDESMQATRKAFRNAVLHEAKACINAGIKKADLFIELLGDNERAFAKKEVLQAASRGTDTSKRETNRFYWGRDDAFDR